MEQASKLKTSKILELNTQYKRLLADMEDLNKDLSYFSECSDEELDEKEISGMAQTAEQIYQAIVKVKKSLAQMKQEIEQDTKTAKSVLSKMKAAKTEYDALRVEYNKEIEAGSSSLKEYVDKCRNIEEKLDPVFVEEYKRIKGFRQNPVAEFKNSRCSGCNMQLPSNATSKILGSDKPVTCENCGRILIIVS